MSYVPGSDFPALMPAEFAELKKLRADLTAGLAGVVTAGTPALAVASSGGSIASAAGPSDGDTVTVGASVYTFKTTLTPANGEVLINGRDGSLTNLEHAINGTGGTPGTDYQVAAAHAFVTAADVASHAIAITGKAVGPGGNVTLSKTGSDITVVSPSGGQLATAAAAGTIMYDSTHLWVAVATVTQTSTTGWKSATLS